jgi:hypothetical protein
LSAAGLGTIKALLAWAQAGVVVSTRLLEFLFLAPSRNGNLIEGTSPFQRSVVALKHSMDSLPRLLRFITHGTATRSLVHYLNLGLELGLVALRQKNNLQ